MSKKDSGVQFNGGIGFTGLLTILFVALKLTGVINWSWVWVLSPIWISIGVVLILILMLAVIGTTVGGKKK